jgi:hypothetical protein
LGTGFLLPVPPAAVLEQLGPQQLVLGPLALPAEPLALEQPSPLAL